MSKDHEIQVGNEIEKLLKELKIVYIMFKTVAAQTNNDAILPIANELKRIMDRIETDILQMLNEIESE